MTLNNLVLKYYVNVRYTDAKQMW